MRALLFYLLGISINSFCQELEWVKGIGSSSTDIGYQIKRSNDGNLLVAGRYQGNVDFNPGTGDSILSSLGVDFFLLKLDLSGNFIWVKKFGGSVNDYVTDLTIDYDGNILMTGYFYSTVDFDPGPGVYNLTAGVGVGGSTNGFVLKLDPDGNFLWANSYGAAGNSDECLSLEVDQSNQVYITGQFGNTADFDESAGVYNLTSSGSHDMFILKLTDDGHFIWAKKIGASGHDAGRGIAIDLQANVVVTGWFHNQPDFDPGPGVYNLLDYGSREAFILKLDSSGNFLWAHALHSSDFVSGYGICTDSLNNIYTVGSFKNEPMWYVNNIDTTFYSNNGLSDAYITKHLPGGEMLWINSWGGLNDDQVTEVEISDTVLYLAGNYTDTMDVDFGVGVENLSTSSGIYDSYVIKIDTSGNYLHSMDYNGASCIMDLEVTDSEIFVTGYFEDSCDFDPGIQISNLYSTASSYDIFIQKLAGCNSILAAPMINDIVLSDDSICLGESVVISVNGSLNDATHWALYSSACGGMLLDINSSGVFNLEPDSSSTYFLQGLGSCISSPGCSTFDIVVNNTTSYINMTACDSVQSPSGTEWYLTSGNYSDTLVSVLGCDSIVNLTLDILNSSGFINEESCDSAIINSMTYYGSGVYQQVLTNVNGCDSLLTIDLTILQPSFDTINSSSCDSVSINGIHYYMSDTYHQFYTGVNGCDSILTVMASVFHSSFESLSLSACDSIGVNGLYYYTSGLYSQILTNSEGCDSTLTLDITITDEIPEIVLGTNSLSCLNAADSYQWYACSSDLVLIVGGINQEFFPDSSGNYAVSISINGCSDTSDCIFFPEVLDMYSPDINGEISITPNPVSDVLSLSFEYFDQPTIKIFSMNGEVIRTFTDEHEKLNVSDLSSGIYVLSIIDSQKIIQISFVKQ